MKFFKSLAFILAVLSASFATEQTCKWIMDVLEMVTDSEDATEFRLYQNSIQVGDSYFVRLRISCENQVRKSFLYGLLFWANVLLRRSRFVL